MIDTLVSRQHLSGIADLMTPLIFVSDISLEFLLQNDEAPVKLEERYLDQKMFIK